MNEPYEPYDPETYYYDENDTLISENLFEGGTDQNAQDNAPKPPKPIDYKFMDGLRGIGAFIAYMSHYMDMFFPYLEQK